MDEQQFAALKEILGDAERSARLTTWEEDFCNDMRNRMLQYGQQTNVSVRQWEVLRRIEEKMYQ